MFVFIQTIGLKGVSHFVLLKRFHGAYYWGLDEMYLWGANLGPKLWSIIKDNNQKLLNVENPLFFKSKVFRTNFTSNARLPKKRTP